MTGFPLFVGLGQSDTTGRLAPDDAQDPEAKTVRELPAGPGGVTLFFVGMGCIGSVQLGKSARSLQLQSMPEWFHTGAPMQIGGATPFTFDHHIPVFRTSTETNDVRKFAHPPRHDLPSRHEGQFVPAVEAPRGPPHISS